MNEFSMVAGYKINMQNQLHVYNTDNEKSQNVIKKIVPFIIASKKNKILMNKFNQITHVLWKL